MLCSSTPRGRCTRLQSGQRVLKHSKRSLHQRNLLGKKWQVGGFQFGWQFQSYRGLVKNWWSVHVKATIPAANVAKPSWSVHHFAIEIAIPTADHATSDLVLTEHVKSLDVMSIYLLPAVWPVYYKYFSLEVNLPCPKLPWKFRKYWRNINTISRSL